MNKTITKALKRAARAAERELARARKAAARANLREFKDRVALLTRAARKGKTATAEEIRSTRGAKALASAGAAVKEALGKLGEIRKLLPAPPAPRKRRKK